MDWTAPASRRVLAGVLAYARGRDWTLTDGPADAAIYDPTTPVPPPAALAVSISTTPGRADVSPDPAAVAGLATEHFRERGYRHLAYVASDDDDATGSLRFLSPLPVLRGRVRKGVFVVENSADPLPNPLPDYRARGPDPGRSAAVAAGDAQPLPLAVVAGDDGTARGVLDALLAAGRRVPGEVAVLGVGDDSAVCELAAVPLSSVDVDPHRLGHLAAARLDKLRGGRPVPDRDAVAPAGVVVRASTDTLAVDDPDVRTALRVLRESGGVAVRVADLMRATTLDRRTLERRFRKALGRPPAEVLRRHRTARAAELLRTTDRPIGDIARACGFRLPQHLAVAFRAAYGQTPGDYRASVR